MFGRAIDQGLANATGGVARGASAVGASRGARLAGAANTITSGLGLKGLMTKFGAFAKVLLPFVIILPMIIGAFRVLKDTTNEATQFLRLSIDELMIALDMIAIQFGQGGGFVQALKDFVDWLGTGVVGVFGFAVKAVEQLVRAVSWMVAVFKGAAYGIGSIMNMVDKKGWSALMDTDAIMIAMGDGIEKALLERRQAEREAYAKHAKRVEEREKKKEEENKKIKGSKPKVEVHIHQDIKTDADPDRIAFKTGEAVKRVGLLDRATSVPVLPGLTRR